MKSKSELTNLYYTTLYPILQKLEKERKEAKNKLKKFWTIISILLVFTTLIFGNIIFLIFLGIIYFVLGGFIQQLMIKDYTLEFKEKIITPLINSLGENLTYHKDSFVPKHLFERSKLFTKPDLYFGNDLVKGTIKDVKISFSDINAKRIGNKDKDHQKHFDTTYKQLNDNEKQLVHAAMKGFGNNKHTQTIFKGLFIVAEFNKNFIGETFILPDTAQKLFGDLVGQWLQSKNAKRDELVKMDDTEFEKKFVVYSNDQIEARYILSNSLMQKLINFEKKTKFPVYVSFVENHLHMAIYYNKDMFEPTLSTSLLDYETATEYIDTLHLVTGVIEELKLNVRIWSKV